jgi:alanyl-tRNA synthetase
MIRLYYPEPWRREFDATVVDVDERGDRLLVYLDRSAFYPDSGGQPHDTGTLGPVRVIDVIDEDERVAHVVERGETSRLTVGQLVTGVIDWPRRFDHMQQHTGQHLLSAAFARAFDVRTQSFHLGPAVSTIDLAREVTMSEIAEAERLANEVVWEDRAVAIRFVSEEEAARLPLRKEPARGGRLRLIDIDGFDLSACGGTHVDRTGRVGIIAVSGTEKVRGGTRVSFVCGGRALRDFGTMRDVLGEAARPLTVAPADLPASVRRMQDEAKELRRVQRELTLRLASLEASAVAARAVAAGPLSVVVEEFAGYDAAALKALASAVVAGGSGRLAVVCSADAPRSIVVARSADAGQIDAGAVLRGIVARCGGKGGGKPDMAQGGGVTAPWDEVRRAALEMAAGR